MPALPALVERTLAWLGTPGNHVVTIGDDTYPARLFDLPDPPPLLYIKGDPALLARPSVAIVGARGATEQGRRDAQAFGRALSESRLAVVSGLALGASMPPPMPADCRAAAVPSLLRVRGPAGSIRPRTWRWRTKWPRAARSGSLITARLAASWRARYLRSRARSTRRCQQAATC
ncbi:DNA-processing protein DprA [Cupriavidus necator]|nr:DNA-processing protein DprA [Cupriavidus necator]MDX6012532.1 DNA-processing protein DprA [Cupriavidus necator]